MDDAAEDPWESLFADAAERGSAEEYDDEELPEAEPDRPIDRDVALRVAGAAFLVGLVILVVRHHDHFLAVQQCFVLAGLALLGLWLSSALVETDRGREVARSSMIGVVGGVAATGFIGMAVLLLP